ncbi:MAG: hypothetical protein AAB935_00845 [Patescibacteria group bacterium]
MINEFVRDEHKDSWELVEDIPLTAMADSKLEIVMLHKKNELWDGIPGEEMRKRAKKGRVNLGQWDAEFLIAHHKIPESLFRLHFVFPGTLWRNPDGELMVPWLSYGYDFMNMPSQPWDWYLSFDKLDKVWGGDSRFFRLSK